MGRVVVLGSVNRDLVLSVAHLPRPGETIAACGFAEHPGGKGANQAVAAARAGIRTLLAGCIGADGFGRAMRDFLGAEGIDLAQLRVIAGASTGIATITVDRQGENVIVVAAGANALPDAALAEAIPFLPGDVAVAPFEVPEVFIRTGFARARAVGAVTLLNPAPMRPLAPALLAITDIVVLNETELAEASGEDSSGADGAGLARQAASLGLQAGQAIIVTRGKAGAVVFQSEGVSEIPGVAADAIDTTGAGNCFVGVLAAGLAEGLALAPALARANRAAAISVTRPGAASSIPSRVEYA